MAQEKKTGNMTSALDALMDSWDEDLQGRALDNNFPYIYSKAYMPRIYGLESWNYIVTAYRRGAQKFD